jgi:hypothetical protein
MGHQWRFRRVTLALGGATGAIAVMLPAVTVAHESSHDAAVSPDSRSLAAVSSGSTNRDVANSDNAAPEAAPARKKSIRVFRATPRKLRGRVIDREGDGLCIQAKVVWYKKGVKADRDYSPQACPKGDKDPIGESAGDQASGHFRASRVKVFKCFDSDDTAKVCQNKPIFSKPF